jgi:enolase
LVRNIFFTHKGQSAKNLGDEGGFAPALDTPDEALNAIEDAIKAAGYEVGKDVKLALDCAASEFYDKETKKYEITEGNFVTSDGLVSFYEKLVQDHPALSSIEDAMDECDYEGWIKFTERLSDKVMVVGDDLYTTNTRLIK